MELYQQQQQNFHPDVIPAPRSRNESYHSSRRKISKAKIRTLGENTADELPQVMFQQLVGSYPMRMTCPYCRSKIMTGTRCKVSIEQKLCCILLCLLGCCLCSCIPCMIRRMCDVEHICPVCKKSVGIYYPQ